MTTADEIAEVPIEKLRDGIKDVADQLDVLRDRMAAVINELASDIAEIAEPRMFDDYQAFPTVVDAVGALLKEVVLPPGTRRPSLPDTPGARKALLALYDAVGREKPD